jgi:hypothetical protein
MSVIQNLVGLIFADYKNNIRPSYKTEISFEINLNQIVSIDEQNQIMTSNVYLKMLWQDERLNWQNNSEFNIFSEIYVPAAMLWLPDIYIINTANSGGFVSITSANEALIRSDNSIFLSIGLNSLKTQCAIDILNFPFDTQTCPIQIGSWQLDDTRLIFTSNATRLDLTSYISNPTWSFTNYSVESIVSKSRFDKGLSGHDVMFKFMITRRPTNYLWNNFFPCFLLNIITFITYWVPFPVQFAASN